MSADGWHPPPLALTLGGAHPRRGRREAAGVVGAGGDPLEEEKGRRWPALVVEAGECGGADIALRLQPWRE
jgi:hypothetical protein